MKRHLSFSMALFAIVLILATTFGCMTVSDKCTIKYTDGTVKTVFNVTKGSEYVTYYLTKTDMEKSQNMVSTPLIQIKEISDIMEK